MFFQINLFKRNSKIILIPLVLFLLIISFIPMKSQVIESCYTDDPCTEPWQIINLEATTNGTLVFPEKYRWRNCGGIIEVVLDFSGTYINSDFFSTDSHNEKDFSGIKEYIEYYILSLMIGGPPLLNLIQDCSQGNLPFIRFYTARCGVWTKCSYKVNVNDEVKKDPGYIGDCPLPIAWQSIPYIDVWKWQSCGTICCQKTYQICREYDPIIGRTIVKIKNVTKGPVEGEECSNQGDVIDWRTGNPRPCIDGCQGDGN